MLVILACIQLWEIPAIRKLASNQGEVFVLMAGMLVIALAALAVQVIKKSARPSLSARAPAAAASAPED